MKKIKFAKLELENLQEKKVCKVKVRENRRKIKFVKVRVSQVRQDKYAELEVDHSSHDVYRRKLYYA